MSNYVNVEMDETKYMKFMTLRDYFAGQALVGLVVIDTKRLEGNEPQHFARWAYALADAMLAESQKDTANVR